MFEKVIWGYVVHRHFAFFTPHFLLFSTPFFYIKILACCKKIGVKKSNCLTHRAYSEADRCWMIFNSEKLFKKKHLCVISSDLNKKSNFLGRFKKNINNFPNKFLKNISANLQRSPHPPKKRRQCLFFQFFLGTN